MRIQYISDLHLEFPENRLYIKQNLDKLKNQAHVLIIAGDLVTFDKIGDIDWFFDYVSKNFGRTYWIPGNHEWYRSNIKDEKFSFKQEIRKNVYLVNNITEQIADHNFIFSTLWSQLDPANSFMIKRSMNDFYWIKYGEHNISIQDYETEHRLSLQFIRESLSKEQSNIVVTHHKPTYMHQNVSYKGNELSSAFQSNLDDFIIENNIHAWIYGHDHHNVKPFKIGKTNILTNQLGYIFKKEQKKFDFTKTFDI